MEKVFNKFVDELVGNLTAAVDFKEKQRAEVIKDQLMSLHGIFIMEGNQKAADELETRIRSTGAI